MCVMQGCRNPAYILHTYQIHACIHTKYKPNTYIDACIDTHTNTHPYTLCMHTYIYIHESTSMHTYICMHAHTCTSTGVAPRSCNRRALHSSYATAKNAETRPSQFLWVQNFETVTLWVWCMHPASWWRFWLRLASSPCIATTSPHTATTPPHTATTSPHSATPLSSTGMCFFCAQSRMQTLAYKVTSAFGNVYDNARSHVDADVWQRLWQCPFACWRGRLATFMTMPVRMLTRTFGNVYDNARSHVDADFSQTFAHIFGGLLVQSMASSRNVTSRLEGGLSPASNNSSRVRVRQEVSNQRWYVMMSARICMYMCVWSWIMVKWCECVNVCICGDIHVWMCECVYMWWYRSVNVWMCVYVVIYMCECVNVSICGDIDVVTWWNVDERESVCVCVVQGLESDIYIHTFMRMYTYMHTYVYIHTYIYIHTRIHIHTCIHTHTHIHTYIHTYMHTYIRMNIYT
jgi:hypothetical protein